MNRRVAPLVVVTALAAGGSLAVGQALSLASAYPGAGIKAERVFLTQEQQRRAEALAGQEIASALVARYVATQEGQAVGRAYVDTHVVRTKKESLLVCLDANGRVKRVEATAFLEPDEYRAPEPWTRQFNGRALDDQLQLNRAIRPIAGATLTAKAQTAAVRRVLAIDRVLAETVKP